MPQEKCYLFFQYQLICSLKNEYFTWRQNQSFPLVKSYFQILPLIKFTDTLNMDPFFMVILFSGIQI